MGVSDEVPVGDKLAAPFLNLLPIAGVAISVLGSDGKCSLVHASDRTSARLEEICFDLGEGPLFDALTTGAAVLVSDVATADEWPLFSLEAVETAAVGVFVFPLTFGATAIGTALCYRPRPGPLDAAEINTGSGLGRAIAGPALRQAMRVAGQEDPGEGSPIELRREVHQATGMVLAQLGSTATDAFARMRAYAFSHELTLGEVARAVVTSRLDFSRAID